MSANAGPFVKPALDWIASTLAIQSMPRPKKKLITESFGQRLVRLRRARAMTQAELGAKVGLSRRMVAYYEGQAGRPPAHVLDRLAVTLGVSADELLGIKQTAHLSGPRSALQMRLWRKLQQLEQLPEPERRVVLKLLDAYLARHGLGESGAA
jgi:transcriptional regulator with XRE-family HTH domain